MGAGAMMGRTRGGQLGFRWHVTPAISTGRPSLRFSTTAAHAQRHSHISPHDMSSAAERGKRGCDGRLAGSGAPARITHRWAGSIVWAGPKRPSTATGNLLRARLLAEPKSSQALQGSRIELHRACVPKGSAAQWPARRRDLKKPASLRFAIWLCGRHLLLTHLQHLLSTGLPRPHQPLRNLLHVFSLTTASPAQLPLRCLTAQRARGFLLRQQQHHDDGRAVIHRCL